jgi:hypothetical protein
MAIRKKSNQKTRRFDNAGAQVLCLRGSFSEMIDSLARITDFGGLRTRARSTDGRNKGL